MTKRLLCVVLDDFQQAAASSADWSALEDAVELRSIDRHPQSEDELVQLIADAEIVVTLRERIEFPRTVFERLPKLQLLIATGMRNSAIDLAAASEHGVVVSGTASSLTPPAELTWALILGLSRHLVSEDAAMRSGGWQSTIGRDLFGHTLGVIGLGRIGAAVAKVGLAFGMKVQAWSSNLTEQRCAEVGVELASSLEALLGASDVVSIHLKLGARSRGLIGAEQLAAMRPSALLVNTSRSAIVDQQALLTALREARIGGAGLDVFDHEPLPADAQIRQAPRTLLTPHLGYVTADNLSVYFTEAVEDISAFLAGTPTRVLNQSN
ncbi:D-2-hydroxyacid dehydrogenase family protein [Psychromicrobium lacuslunae]|uniref:2-hydroxyacid dehydrogenase n=1 Tax=Psychromicrobium lacuslunae TaxID=1618207 RepID=A0A0D4BVL9_9MICC|nr:D-2-hydroxyacid dehydrogenase family protein [Psychromicrobium lacuslunae]AJT40364.1 2-hydroxyacid dehydrogenase [Psychromicrobium lacuslunae]